MLDIESADAPTPADAPETRLRWTIAALGALGLILPAAFYPLLYNTVRDRDDEGFFLITLRDFLHHGSLYSHTFGGYGPFYFSTIGLIYRVIGQDPTLTNGRLIVLVFTTLTAVFFAAAVWRVSRSMGASLLCQTATFCVLIKFAGNEPLHPGSLISLLLSALAYTLACYAAKPRPYLLTIAGAIAGALTLTKVNVGVFTIAALAMALLVGNLEPWRVLRYLTAIGGVVLPFVLVFQLRANAAAAVFAALVSFSVLATVAVLMTDTVHIPSITLLGPIAGGAAVLLASAIWPLSTGTSVSKFVYGSFVRPIQQVGIYTFLPVVSLRWLDFGLTIVVVGVVIVRRDEPWQRWGAWLPDLVLALAALWLIGLGITGTSGTKGTLGAWLPILAVLPALALMSRAEQKTRMALRLLVPLSVLQLLHAYPVAGSQIGWATVAMFVPCSIALAYGLGRQPIWRRVPLSWKALATASLCILVVLSTGLWPLAIWKSYGDAAPLKLPGAAHVRIDASAASTLERLARVVRRHCDTFYSAPGLDSLYIYTELPPPTGELANWPGVMTDAEQTEVATQLAHLHASGKRVCIVRDMSTDARNLWLASSYPNGPLGQSLRHYRTVIAKSGLYTVSVTQARAPALRTQPPGRRSPSRRPIGTASRTRATVP